MQVKVLGCSGGIGTGLRTTSLLMGDEVLIDCGTGVGDLSLSQLQQIRHVFLTHAHLDHVCMLPMLIDTVFDSLLDETIKIHASREVLDILKKHLFNWHLWPDFFALPNSESPVLLEAPIEINESVVINGKEITALPVEHSVPAQGYYLSGDNKGLAFSGDTGEGRQFWDALNVKQRLDYLIVECAYGEDEQALAKRAKHYCPSLLVSDFSYLKHAPEVFITHLKPACESVIVEEISELLGETAVQRLQSGHIFTL